MTNWRPQPDLNPAALRDEKGLLSRLDIKKGFAL
jgi:hypothetical protein